MKLRLRLNKRWLGLGITVASAMIAIISSGAATPQKAEAAACPGPVVLYGRPQFCGYFNSSDRAEFGDFVLTGGGSTGVPASVDNGASFINMIKSYLQGSKGETDKTGAEFIVETMLGNNGGTRTKADANVGSADYNKWVSLIDQYDAAPGGLIKWNYQYFETASTKNSYYQLAPEDDDAFFIGDEGNNGFTSTIAFFSPTGKMLYVIRRACGNPLGDLIGLSPLIQPYALKLTLAPAAGTPAYTTGPGTGIIEPGKTYHLTPTVTDPTAVKANALIMEVENLTPAYLQNAGATGGGQATWAGYMGAACQSGVSPCWRWNFDNGLTKDSASTETNGVSFTVSAATPQGASVCFLGTITPSTNVAGSRLSTPKYCYLVYTPVIPAVVGNNGDVHAGGGLCDAALTNGSVTGYAGAGSGSAYVVSASGAIDDFGSSGTVSGSAGDTSLLGNTGNYAQVCREDLLNGPNGANAYYSGANAKPAGTYSITGWAAGVYYFNGSITISGRVDNKMTIVERSGNVTIGPPGISLSAASLPANQVPSLGIIASADIDIDNTVSLVDAYLFADGDINTCIQANASCATAPLVVNGFLMAKDLNFQRLGPSAAKGATVVEQINLNPQIYLNPPRFFDASVDSTYLVGQGEGSRFSSEFVQPRAADKLAKCHDIRKIRPQSVLLAKWLW